MKKYKVLLSVLSSAHPHMLVHLFIQFGDLWEKTSVDYRLQGLMPGFLTFIKIKVLARRVSSNG